MEASMSSRPGPNETQVHGLPEQYRKWLHALERREPWDMKAVNVARLRALLEDAIVAYEAIESAGAPSHLAEAVRRLREARKAWKPDERPTRVMTNEEAAEAAAVQPFPWIGYWDEEKIASFMLLGPEGGRNGVAVFLDQDGETVRVDYEGPYFEAVKAIDPPRDSLIQLPADPPDGV
jgi:hypothetical protein